MITLILQHGVLGYENVYRVIEEKKFGIVP